MAKKKKTATQAFIEADKKKMAAKKARSNRLFNVPELPSTGYSR